jgi:hypothetical protein
LKSVAEIIKYPLKHPDQDGAMISSQFIVLLKKRMVNNCFLDLASEYNEDDVMLLPYIIDYYGQNFEFFDYKQYRLEHDRINSLIVDKHISSERIRFSCKIQDYDLLKYSMMNLGLPLPSDERQGKNVASLAWRSKLSILSYFEDIRINF